MATIQEQLQDVQGQLRRGAQTDYLLTLNKLEKTEFDAFKAQIQGVLGTTVQEVAQFTFGSTTIQDAADVLLALLGTSPIMGEYILAVQDGGTLTYAVGSGATATTLQLDVVAGQSVSIKVDALGSIISASIVQIGGTGSGTVTAIDWNEPYTTEFADQLNALQVSNPSLYAQLVGYILPNP